MSRVHTGVGRRRMRMLSRPPTSLRAAASILLAAIAVSACSAVSSAVSPGVTATLADRSTARSCLKTFVPSYFYSGTLWDKVIDTKPAPGVMLLNVDNGVGTAPLSHFRKLVKAAQRHGIKVLGYSSTDYADRPVAQVESEISHYKKWYRVNGIFLDLTQGTAAALPYYRRLSRYIRAAIPDADVWLNPGSFPARSFMSIASVVMVFEGSDSSFLVDRVPGWVRHYHRDRFAQVVYAMPRSDLTGTRKKSWSRGIGNIFMTNLPGSPNPYATLPRYWAKEAAAVPATC
jgi:hypothetical protein